MYAAKCAELIVHCSINIFRWHFSFIWTKLCLMLWCLNIIRKTTWQFWLSILIGVWWRHMAKQIWVNIDSGNGLLPDGTKPLPGLMLISYCWGSVASTCQTCVHDILRDNLVWFAYNGGNWLVLESYSKITLPGLHTLWLLASLCVSFEFRVPVDFIYGHPNSHWIKVTW